MITSGSSNIAESCDVVVMGSGAAGMVSAIRAADAGLSVQVLEKADQLGGTTALGGGVMWAPHNHLMATAGFADTAGAAKDYITAAAGPRMSASAVDWYATTAPAAVRYLAERTRVSFRPLNRPDYHMEWPGAASGGRGLDNDPFDPAEYPGLAAALRPSSYFPLITMNERDGLQGAPIDAGLLEQRASDGVRTMGGALAGSLIASGLDRRIHVASAAAVSGLSRADDGGGWVLTINDGEATVRTGNVVIASGGFEWNQELCHALLKHPITPISAPSNEGDGLTLGLAAGAGIQDMTAVWGVPVITPPDAVYDGKPSGRMGNVEMTLPGSMTVNSTGQRFVNEAMNYHDLARVFGNVDPITSGQQNNPAWMIFDHRYMNRYPVAGSTPGVPEPWMVSAGTIPELAGRLGIDGEGLAGTLERFNASAADGEDREFGRGSTVQDRHLGDPSNRPNPCLAPLTEPPYYAVPIHAGVLGTAGGLRVNLSGQVTDAQNAPISGLYAAGNCSATVFRDAYPGGGTTLGSAITRAYAIGEHLSSPTR